MKHIYSLAIALSAFTFSFATPIKLEAPVGNWTSSSNWNLHRSPTNGDTIVIPSNTTLVINNDLTLSDVHVRVYGTVSLTDKNTQINLDNQSDVVVYEGGKIQGVMASQKLRINGTLIYQGNDPAVLGPATATASLAGFQPIILPVKFLGFSAARKGSEVLVQWSTSEEVNADSYQVERSFDGANWTTITAVAAAGNSTALHNYAYTDRSTGSKAVYYRVKQIDRNGMFAYTTVRAITSETSNADIRVASVQNKVVLQFPQEIKSGVSVRIISLSGQVVHEKRIEQPVGQVILNASVKGNYIVSVSNGQEVNVARQVIL